MIGFFEVTSINRRVEGEQSAPRPLTHDLLTAIIDNLGGELQDIYINELAEHTYFAKLRIRKDMANSSRSTAGPATRSPWR